MWLYQHIWYHRVFRRKWPGYISTPVLFVRPMWLQQPSIMWLYQSAWYYWVIREQLLITSVCIREARGYMSPFVWPLTGCVRCRCYHRLSVIAIKCVLLRGVRLRVRPGTAIHAVIHSQTSILSDSIRHTGPDDSAIAHHRQDNAQQRRVLWIQQQRLDKSWESNSNVWTRVAIPTNAQQTAVQAAPFREEV